MSSGEPAFAPCPVCHQPGYRDRADLAAMQATCSACGWHYTDSCPATAGEDAQRYERRLRDAVLDELVDWLGEEEGTHVAIRDVLEQINTIRTRKP